MAERTSREYVRLAVLGIGGAAAAFFMFGGLSTLGKSGSSDPFDAIPRSSFIAATVDVAELRRSPVYEAFFGKESPGGDPMRRALGVGALADACGFDPTTRVQRIAVSVPEEGDRGEFGVAARVEVTREELETCTRALAGKRGGKAETHDVGSFVVLEDTGSSAGGNTPAVRPRLAYGRGGLLVVGKGTWFDAMLGAADRTKPGLRDATEHVALRTSLTSHEGFRAPTILATAVLPRALRERLKGEMGAEASSQDTSSAIMAGVLGVSAVGIAIHAGGSGQNVDASIELVCDNAEACEAVDKLAQKKRGEWSRDLSLRMIGFGPLLDSFEVKHDGARLRATATASGDALAATIERVLKLRARRGAADGPPQGDEPRRRPDEKRPDEMLHARPDAGR
ncbi:MAG: hypothetical protein JWP87_5151 [Labilithrix sp.]|nr:hypothetical protein [Labilithrix sp.]